MTIDFPGLRQSESDAANAMITQNSPRGLTNVKDPVTRFSSYHFIVIQLWRRNCFFSQYLNWIQNY